MSTYLQVIHPVEVTEYMLVSCSVAEDEYDTYPTGSPWSTGDRVIKNSQVWECVNDGVTTDPETIGTTDWVLVGPTNRWKSLNLSVSSQTVQTGTISYRITPGAVVNSVAFMAVEGVSIRVRVDVPSLGVIYDTTRSIDWMIRSPDWYSLVFGDYDIIDEVLFEDLPSFVSADILIDIDGGVGDAKVGVIAMGQLSHFNFIPLHGLEWGLFSYSTVTTDYFGTTKFTKRGSADTTSIPCYLRNTDFQRARRALKRYDSTPCVWVVPDFIMLCGAFDDVSIQVSYPQDSDCSINLKSIL